MPAVKRLRHQQAARADLLDIWHYTDRTWGRDQADTYLTEIDALLQNIASGQVTGLPYGATYLKRRINSHVVFYRDAGEEVMVVRVLHARMDTDRHLPN